MMKRLMILILSLTLSTVCLGQGAAWAGSDANKTSFTLGCMPLNLPTVELIKEFLIPPYEMEIVVFDANHLPAVALKDGNIDSLILNHDVWIETFNKQHNANLIMVKPYFYHSIFGIYSMAYKKVEELPEKSVIAIPGDPSNMDRALRLLQDAKLIKLGEKTGEFFSLLDVAENPRNFKFYEMEVTATVRAIRDCAAILSYSSQLKQAGLLPEKFRIFTDHENFETGIVVMPDNVDQPWVKAVVDTVQLDGFKKRFNEFWQGAYVLVNK